MRFQRTIRNEVTVTGIGVHTGRSVSVRLLPAAPDHGIIFFRTDKGVHIRADVRSVVETSFCTTLGGGGIKVRTVEHLLAAASGLGVDNLLVEIDGPEVPVLDGSALNFVSAFLDAGVARQGKIMPHLRILQPVSYEDAHARISVLPYDGRRITYKIDFSNSMLGRQELRLELNEQTFVEEVAPARTFGFLKDLDALRANGLAQGASLANAIAIGEQGVMNPTGLRYRDEFVRHKALDAIGDLSLVGMPLLGHVFLEKSGHRANVNFVTVLLQSPESFVVVTEDVDRPAVSVLN
ncbi:MAG TPA: UDP-3-O-acyl-N-acetylglucosamine deacetylase [Dissulfurispiraceae bacterium]|nr:UDP-3-O-acyl-N-acetylglucosamine deacetylase [Dissulfurispiraceae bacterium]